MIGIEGDRGEEGPSGMSITGAGVVYVTWGQSDCPSTYGTEQLYQGLAAAARNYDTGTGTNLLCLPNDPSFKTSIDPSATEYAAIVGVKYATLNEPFQDLHNTRVSCSVCYTTQATQLMIPGCAVCPDEPWRLEYIGYLMSSRNTPSESLPSDGSDSHFRTKYICVSSNAENGSTIINNDDNDEAELYHVHLDCEDGASLECNTTSQQLTCALCTLTP